MSRLFCSSRMNQKKKFSIKLVCHAEQWPNDNLFDADLSTFQHRLGDLYLLDTI